MAEQADAQISHEPGSPLPSLSWGLATFPRSPVAWSLQDSLGEALSGSGRLDVLGGVLCVLLLRGAGTAMPRRAIAIGDIHGCSLALKALLDAIGPGQDDLLVFLGDYIDRGPDSRGVLEEIITLRGRCTVIPLLGNHEEMLLAATRSRSALKEWLDSGGKQMLASYGLRAEVNAQSGWPGSIPKEHWRFFGTCSAFYETETHVFTHANYLPDRAMDQQPADALRWQFVNPTTARPHYSGKVVVVGHTPQRSGEVLDLGFLKCIDTACEPGKWLTALDVGTGKVWQANKRGVLRG